jgi:phenylpropionate dioxygenase-like ring-hydroxylating dioxygenase large terminal subunit
MAAYDLADDLRAMAKRALANLAAGTTDMTAHVWHEPVANYADQARHDREIDVLFRRTPLLVGLSCDWPTNGAYRTFDLIPDSPLVLVRGEDGVLRAFLNVCRHRGARIVHEPHGDTRRFRCPFHAWTYTNSGALVGLPFAEGFPTVDRNDYGLTEVACAEWHGMVWVMASPGATIDLATHLGPLAPLLAAQNFERAERFIAHSLTATNWKLAVDTYLEGYHFASLHPKTINPINYDNLMVFDAYGPHTRQGFPRRNVHDMAALPEDEWDVPRYITCVYQLFPNVAFTVSPEGILINAVYPGGRYNESTTVQTHYTREPLTTDEQRATMEWRSSLVRDVVREEDYWMTASIQAGTKSGAQTHVVFGRNEQALHHYHRALIEAVPDAAVPVT